MRETHVVDMSWDEEASVWVAVCDSLPLALESGSYDALIERVKMVAREMAELNNLSPLFNLTIQSKRLVTNG